jgi:hypothetical protein
MELQQRLQQAEEEKANDAVTTRILRGWIGDGRAR